MNAMDYLKLKKNRLGFVMLLCLFICVVCGACSKDTPDLNEVRVQVEANTDEPVRIYGIENSSPESGIVIRRGFDHTFTTESQMTCIVARCKDGNTLITIKVWVNKKLKANVFGNKYVSSGDILFR